MQSPESELIVSRFFATLEDMARMRKISSITAFYLENNMNRRNMSVLQKEKNRDIMQLAWLTLLVEKYGVSAHYLLTGKGKRYDKEIFAVIKRPGRPTKVQVNP